MPHTRSRCGRRAAAVGICLLSVALAPLGARAGTILITSDVPTVRIGETATLSLWIEIGSTELIRGVQATFEFSNMDPPAAPVFIQVPDLAAGAIMAPWGLSSTIAQTIGDPANVVTVIQANSTDQSLATLAPLVPLGLFLLNDNALPLGSVTLTGGTRGAVLASFVAGRDHLCSNTAEDCQVSNLAGTVATGLMVLPEPATWSLLVLAAGALALRARVRARPASR